MKIFRKVLKKLRNVKPIEKPIVENLLVSDYIKHTFKNSSLIPGLKTRGKDEFHCPRCSIKLPCPTHGAKQSCTSCGLHMISFGNSLKISNKLSGLDSV